MKRRQTRHGDGRFKRNTLESVCGIKAPVCVECRTFNPHPVGTPRPEKCHACGAKLVDVAETQLEENRRASQEDCNG